MVNTVVLVGRLTRDPELRRTSNGTSVTSFTVAVNRRYTSQNSTQTADFINCVAWRSTAEFLANYAKKGNMVSVEGRIQSRTYDNNQGVRQYVTEVVADSVNLLEKRQNNDSQNQYPSQNDTNDNQMNNFGQNTYKPQVESDAFGDDPFESSIASAVSDDDLPF